MFTQHLNHPSLNLRPVKLLSSPGRVRESGRYANSHIVFPHAALTPNLQAIALAFAKASATNLIIASRSVAKLEATKAEILNINSKSKVLVVGVDTTSEVDVEKLEKAVKDTFGHADVLVNNSGQWAGRGNIEELNVKAWWRDLVRALFPFPIYTIYLTNAGGKRKRNLPHHPSIPPPSPEIQARHRNHRRLHGLRHGTTPKQQLRDYQTRA